MTGVPTRGDYDAYFRRRRNRQHTTLYRLYDADDRLLYVGIAGNPGRRFGEHATTKKWWGQVSTIRCEHFAGRRQAERAEAKAVRDERPIYNVIYNDPRPEPPPVVDVPDRLAYPFHEAAALLDVDLETLEQMVDDGVLRAVRIGGRDPFRILATELAKPTVRRRARRLARLERQAVV